jgi:hypothetical protein
MCDTATISPALLVAASSGNWREVRNLLLDGADPSDSDYEGQPFTPGLDDVEMLLQLVCSFG